MKLALLPFATLLLAAVFASQGKPPPQLEGKTAQQWVEELGSPSSDAAINALVKLGPVAALPDLAACVESRQDETVWQAARAIRRLTASNGSERIAFDAAAERIGRSLTKADRTLSSSRCVLVAIAGIGPNSEKAAPHVATFLRSVEDPSSGVIAALAFRGIGPKGAPAVATVLKDSSITSAFTALAGCSAYDKTASSLVKPLTALITKDDTARGYLLCRAGHKALENIVGVRKAGDALDQRLEMHRGKFVVTSPVNFGALLPTKKDIFVLWLAQELHAGPGLDPEVVALPVEHPNPLDGVRLTLGDAVRAYAEHFINELPGLAERLNKDEFKTIDAWSKAAEPARQCLELVRAITSH